MWYVYILRCRDSSYYTGMTDDIQKRLQRHNQGNGAKYTRPRRPVEFVYAEELGSKGEALSREFEIKKLSRKNKEKLINFASLATK